MEKQYIFFPSTMLLLKGESKDKLQSVVTSWEYTEEEFSLEMR